MSSKIKKSILKLKESSTLVINEKCKELIKQGKKVEAVKHIHLMESASEQVIHLLDQLVR